MQSLIRVLITGGTGAIGITLIQYLLQQGISVSMLVRPKGGFAAFSRTNRNLLSHIGILYGDVREEMCGVSPEEIDKLSGKFDAVIHCAGKVQYHDDKDRREDTIKTNHGGVLNCLELAGALGIPRFLFTSTAYVGGTRWYLGEDEKGDQRTTQNPYEESKVRAEESIRAWTGGEAAILRLSTVIGNSETGYLPTEGGYSAFVKGLWAQRKRLAQFTANPFLVAINPLSTLNLVPNDWVTHMIHRVLVTKSANGTFHLTHPTPVSLGWLFEETFQRILRYPVSFDPAVVRATALPHDRIWRLVQESISGLVAYFDSYVEKDTIYGHERVRDIPGYIPPHEITRPLIARQVGYMTSKLFAKKEERRETVTA